VSAGARELEPLSVEDYIPNASAPEELRLQPPSRANPAAGRTKALPSIAPDPSPDGLRSRFDDGAGLVSYNDRHPDYLMVKAEEAALLDYLSTLVAKEHVVFNNPRAAPGELAEEMVRMLVRVRRYLPTQAISIVVRRWISRLAWLCRTKRHLPCTPRPLDWRDQEAGQPPCSFVFASVTRGPPTSRFE